jgi:hypothetical protein
MTMTTATPEEALAVAVLIDLQARGVELRADGEELRAAPRAVLTSTDRTQLQELKPSLLNLLRQGGRGDERRVPAPTVPNPAPDPEPMTNPSLIDCLEVFVDAMSKPLPTAPWSQNMHDTALNIVLSTPVVILERRANTLVATVGDRTWYAYSLAPVDLGWGAAPTVDMWLLDEDVADPEPPLPEEEIDYIHQSELLVRRSLWAQAQAVAARLGWEGEFIEARVFTLPDTQSAYRIMTSGFVFKQSNNGTTFVVSPVPMPWLDDGWGREMPRPARGVSPSQMWRN